jgi:hypothetical protein
MILLTIALFFDSLVNIVRIIEVERGMRYQREFLFKRDEELIQVIEAIVGKDKA